MKISGFIFLSLIEAMQAFLQFPLSANGMLGDFLTTLEGKATINLDHAVRGEECNRECRPNDVKICKFAFMMKYFQIMGGACANCSVENYESCLIERCVQGDGVARSFLAINFQLPSPAIHVCKDDIIVVDLTNEAEGAATTLHWHGILQHKTAFMDGVPYVTQCPIPFGNKFRYAFHVSEAGTHFYHAHAGHQKANGLFGALIVREPEKLNPNAILYDYDLPQHTIIVSEWMHRLAEEDFPGLTSRSVLTKSILINGHGRYFNVTSDSYTFAPWAVFNVKPGKRYRFRFINSGFNVCPFVLQFEGHNMSVVATEGSNVKPLVTDALYSVNGERFDFVLVADKEPKDYWIRIQTIFPCRTQIESFAILRYGEDHRMVADTRVAFSENKPPRFSNELFSKYFPFNSPMPNIKINDIPLTSLEAYDTDHSIVDNPPDFRFFLFIDSPTIFDETLNKFGNYYRLSFETSRPNFTSIGTFNNISLKFPESPLLTQPEDIDESEFCNENSTVGQYCFDNKFLTACRCLHVIKVDLNSNVELVLVNVDDLIAHPVHLHGHKFHVLDMGVFEKKPEPGRLRKGLIPNKSSVKDPPYKDTVALPFPGYTRLRFRADNPGYWLMHCHFDWHMSIGMAVVFQVGTKQQIMAKTKVPEKFPKCGNFDVHDIV